MSSKEDKDEATLEDVVNILLDKGTVITANVPITVGDVELLSLKIQPLMLASFDTAKEAGLEIPSVKKK